MNSFTIMLDAIGIIGFSISIYYSFKNYRLTKYASPVYGIYYVSMAIAFIWCLSLILNAFGFFPLFIERITSHILTFLIGFLTVLIILKAF